MKNCHWKDLILKQLVFRQFRIVHQLKFFKHHELFLYKFIGSNFKKLTAVPVGLNQTIQNQKQRTTNMALVVTKVVNKTDAELDIVDNAHQSTERVPEHSSKPVPSENLLDLTFISKTGRPIYIKIRSLKGDGDIGNGDEPVEVEVGDDEEEENGS